MDAQAAKAASQIISIHANGCQPTACERMRRARQNPRTFILPKIADFDFAEKLELQKFASRDIMA